MTATTIKVSRETRDRLKAQAARHHRTLGEHLARLAEPKPKPAPVDRGYRPSDLAVLFGDGTVS